VGKTYYRKCSITRGSADDSQKSKEMGVRRGDNTTCLVFLMRGKRPNINRFPKKGKRLKTDVKQRQGGRDRGNVSSEKLNNFFLGGDGEASAYGRNKTKVANKKKERKKTSAGAGSTLKNTQEVKYYIKV